MYINDKSHILCNAQSTDKKGKIATNRKNGVNILSHCHIWIAIPSLLCHCYSKQSLIEVRLYVKATSIECYSRGKLLLILQWDKIFSLFFLSYSYHTLVICCSVTTQDVDLIICVQIDPHYSLLISTRGGWKLYTFGAYFHTFTFNILQI